jgi:type II secretory pathway pseudopilin PulG
MILEATAMKTETEPKPPPLDGLQPRFLHSISGRLVAGLVIALVVSGGLLVTMALWLGQQSVKAEQEQAAARLVQVFEASLHTSMLQRDLPSLQRTLQVWARHLASPRPDCSTYRVMSALHPEPRLWVGAFLWRASNRTVRTPHCKTTGSIPRKELRCKCVTPFSTDHNARSAMASQMFTRSMAFC